MLCLWTSLRQSSAGLILVGRGCAKRTAQRPFVCKARWVRSFGALVASIVILDLRQMLRSHSQRKIKLICGSCGKKLHTVPPRNFAYPVVAFLSCWAERYWTLRHRIPKTADSWIFSDASWAHTLIFYAPYTSLNYERECHRTWFMRQSTYSAFHSWLDCKHAFSPPSLGTLGKLCWKCWLVRFFNAANFQYHVHLKPHGC